MSEWVTCPRCGRKVPVFDDVLREHSRNRRKTCSASGMAADLARHVDIRKRP